jgi:alpha-tubulin suppressor-like RCC1 family protein
MVYNGKYVAMGGLFRNTTTWPHFLGGLEGEKTSMNITAFFEPTWSSKAGDDVGSFGANLQTPIVGIKKLVNTGESQLLIDDAGSLYSFGGDTDTAGYGVILGNCLTSSTEGKIGYKIGSGTGCTQDGSSNAIPTTGWKEVEAYIRYDQPNYNHACAIDGSDQLWCWGYNASGQLGTGNTTQQNRPTLITQYVDDAEALQTMPTVSKIVTGLTGSTTNDGGNTLIITTAGIPMVTGRGLWGATGDGNTNNNNNFETLSGDLSQTSLTTDGATVVDAWFQGGYAGGYCAIRRITATGVQDLYCWGHNAGGGQVGDGTQNLVLTPFKVDFSTVKRSSGIVGNIGATYSVLKGGSTRGYWSAINTCAIVSLTVNDTQGGLYCWGDNTQYGVGDGTTTDRNSPVPVLTDASTINDGWTDIWMGDNHVIGLTTYGTKNNCATNAIGGINTYCWGYNQQGSLWENEGNPLRDGLGAGVILDYVAWPILMPALSGKFIVDLYCKPWGNQQSCMAIDTAGEIYCSGERNGSCPGTDNAGNASVGTGWFQSAGKQMFLK